MGVALLRQGDEWQNPVYHQSRKVSIDRVAFKKNRCIGMEESSLYTEYYKILRTKILPKMQKHQWKTLMVTSVSEQEGKTLTAVNLSMAFALTYNQTVLLVDSDLKKQAVHKYLGYESHKGLIDYLMDDVPLSQLIAWPGIDKLTVISGGRTIADSSELLSSPKMGELVAQMKVRYPERYIIFDVPPVIGRSDALAFSQMADCVLLVVRARTTPRHLIEEALRLIPEKKILGFVFNRQT